MALVVEIGAGVPTANTFVDVATADAYYAYNDTWKDTDTTLKEAALIAAGRYLNGLSWVGMKTDRSNGMCWPRLDADGVSLLVDREGIDIPKTEVPKEVKDAQCELAYRALSGELLPDADRGGRIKRQKVDVLETEYFSSAPSGTTFPTVTSILKGLVKTSYSLDIQRA